MDEIGTQEIGTERKRVSRRTVVRAAAWSVPVLAVAVAAPTAAASVVDVGAFHIDGTCGVLGLLGPGFTLTAGSADLPIGTTIQILGSGVADIGVFSVTGGTASVAVLSGTSRQITLIAALPAGQTIAFRSTISISVDFTLTGIATAPPGYVATGSKPAGTVQTAVSGLICNPT